jgi:hypothetical protein
VAIVTSLGPEPRPEPEPYDGPQEGEGGSSQSVEDAVQQVVFDLHRAIENHSADSALACFASGAKGKPSRSDFTRAEGYGNTRTSSPRNFRGFWSNGDTAGITCDIYYEDYDGKSGTVGHRYGFRRVGGTWRISSKQGT